MQGAASVAAGQLLRIGRIAAGGMGYVELVLRIEGSFRRLYARKRIHEHYRDDRELRQMFLEEARVAGLLRHPNVIGVLDVGEDDEGPFLLMDFVDGLAISALIADARARDDLLPVEICVEIARQVALALHAAHELTTIEGRPLHLVHRDVSPQNVLVDYDGTVRLGDFGVAKALGRAGASTHDALKGKTGYMAPEQLRFEPLDRRSDLFSLGVVLYELLAADRLYGGRDVPGVARKILDDPPPDIGEVRSDVPIALEELLLDLLAKDREQRPADAASVARRLAGIGAELGEGAIELAALMKERFGSKRAQLLEERNSAIERVESSPGRGAASADVRMRGVALGEESGGSARRVEDGEPVAAKTWSRRPVARRSRARRRVAIVALALGLASVAGVVVIRGAGWGEAPSAGVDRSAMPVPTPTRIATSTAIAGPTPSPSPSPSPTSIPTPTSTVTSTPTVTDPATPTVTSTASSTPTAADPAPPTPTAIAPPTPALAARVVAPDEGSAEARPAVRSRRRPPARPTIATTVVTPPAPTATVESRPAEPEPRPGPRTETARDSRLWSWP